MNGESAINTVVLTIAGSDTSAGAGIQQDLKTITAMGSYGVTAITALTAQNTVGVQRVLPVDADMLKSQLDSLRSDIRIDAIKIGMLPNKECAQVVTDFLSTTHCPVVCDPVMVSSSGTPLMDDACIAFMTSQLFPRCTLVTPNLPESQRLTSMPQCDDVDHMGTSLMRLATTAWLIKGGHSDASAVTDTLFLPDGSVRRYTSPRITSLNTHGTGCTLSSAIATALAQGMTLTDAVATAKRIIAQAISDARTLRIGHGHGPLWVKGQ